MSYSLLDKIIKVESPTGDTKGYHLSKTDTIRKFDFTKTGSNTIGTSFGTVTANNDSKYGVMFATDETKNALLGYASHPSAPLGNNMYEVSLKLKKIAVVDVLGAVKEKGTGRHLTVDEILQGRQSLIDAGYDGMRIVGAPSGKLLENTLVVLNDPDKIDITNITNTQNGQSLYTKPVNPAVPTPPSGGNKPPSGPKPKPQPSGRQPNSKMSHLFDNNRFVSIDIETSGRDAAKDKIWNIGLKWSNGKKRNLFLVDDASYTMGHSADASVLAQREQVVDRMKAQLESGNFGKRQAAKGSFNDLYKAIREGTAITSEGAAKYISNIVGHLGASNQAKFTLIQNARFEDQFLTKLMQDYGVFDKAKHGMEFRTNYTEGYAGFLYSPPDITTLKANAAQSFEKYLAGTGSFDEVAKHHEAIVNSYFSHINNAPKGISVDLMDLTKAFYAKAAEKGLLRKQDIHVGTNIEFLSQLFYDQAEAHTGLEDAVLQEKLAVEKMSDVYGRMTTDTLTNDDRNILVKASEMQQRAHRLQLISGLKTGLEESQTAAGYKLTGTRKFYPLTPIIDSQNRLHPLSVYRQIDAHYTKDVAATIEDVVNSSARRLEVHPDDVKSILNEIGKHDDVDCKIAALYEMGDNYWGKPKIPSKPMPTKQEVKESVGWLKSLNGAQKTVVGLGVAGALYAGLSDDNASKHKVREIKKRKEYRERRYDLDSNMRIYSKLDNYHGSGFATWNDRTKHHEY